MWKLILITPYERTEYEYRDKRDIIHWMSGFFFSKTNVGLQVDRKNKTVTIWYGHE